MGVVALILAIAISIEIYASNKKFKKMEELEKERLQEEEENINSKLNIKESADIKYVDEDSELEKTKAKMELARLREQLKQEEEEKQKLIEMNLELSRNIKENKIEEEKEIKEEQIELENNKTEIKETTEEVQKINIEESNKEIKKEVNKERMLDDALSKIKPSEKISKHIQIEVKEPIENDIEVLDDYRDDEENAIISYEELKNAQSFGYTDDEMDRYVDEKDAIISIQELEKLYLESQKIEVPVPVTPKVEFEMKRVEDLPEIADKNNFQKSPFISPVYGMSKSDQELILEQTANLEKLNEEIRNTNEFLKTLKDLNKNLE